MPEMTRQWQTIKGVQIGIPQKYCPLQKHCTTSE
jgi:hypothetical protein